MDKISLNERDICTKFITPALLEAGWQQSQFRQEVNLTDGRVIVRGTLATRSRTQEPRVVPSVPTTYSTHTNISQSP